MLKQRKRKHYEKKERDKAMSLFDIFKSDDGGGFMDVIRCDKQDYLVYKWSPNGVAKSTKREIAIRYGSRLRVKPGEAAVFVYPQKDGSMLDIIEGPTDETIKTANFPVLAGIVGLSYGGDSPFIAEVYFFNLQQNIQVKFGIPYFDVFDNRFPDLGVPCALRGTITFNISGYADFIKLYRLANFEIDDLKEQIKDLYTRKIKSIILNLPAETGLSVMQLERLLDEINQYTAQKLGAEMEADFGINLKRIDISSIEIYKTHPNYVQLKEATANQQTRFTNAKTDVEITNLTDLARIQRKVIEMGVEAKNFTIHQINQQADILKTAAQNIGAMGNTNLGNGGGFNPRGMATGMAIGGSVGTQMGSMMGNVTNTPPPPPAVLWHIAVNGQQSGPYTVEQLKEFAALGQFTKEYHVWKQGMAQWAPAETTPGFAEVFTQVTPPPPPPATTDVPKRKTSGIDLTKK